MNVDGLVSSLQGTLGRLGQSLVVQGDGRFSDTLTLGQVLKGKVLMHYEGTRYSVSFGGDQRVVDSAIPLKTGEVIYGRVVALGDKVHLQRLASQEAEQPPKAAVPSERPLIGGASARERMVAQLFDRYQGSLTLKEQALLKRLISAAEKPELMALSALVLNKAGLTLNVEAILGVLRVLEREQPAALRKTEVAPRLLLVGDGQAIGKEEVLSLAQALHGMIEFAADDSVCCDVDSSAGSMHEESGLHGNDAGHEHRERGDERHHLGTWLLNCQSDGAVAHRMTTFPIWFGDSLVEVSVALFSQREHALQHSELRHRRVVLALDTERLGHVELVVGIARHNLSVEVRAQDDEATESLAAHLHVLREQLVNLGWIVDGISYATVRPGDRGEVVRSVVEHFVTRESVNQLV